MARRVEAVEAVLAPHVLVLWTKEAEAACMQKGISCRHLLTPFGHNRGQTIDVQFRTLDDLKPLDVRDGIQQTKAAVSRHDGLCEDWKIASGAAPWFQDYCRQFFSLMRPSEQEFFCRPLMRLVLCTAKGDDPITAISHCLTSQKLKDCFSKYPFLARELSTCYLVLSDEADDEETLTAFNKRMANDFGPRNCFHVALHKGADDGDVSDVWTAVLPHIASESRSTTSSPAADKATQPSSPVHGKDDAADPLTVMATSAKQAVGSGVLAHGLGTGDVQRLKDAVAAFAQRCLLPTLKHEIHQLTQEVAATRKSRSTFLNATRKWFSSSKTTQASAADSYASDSFEMQNRKLADLLVMTKEYQEAYHHYRHLRKDFTNDRSWKHLACANELLATCMLCDDRIDQTRYEPRQLFEAAVATYQKNGMPFHSTRCALAAAAFYTTKGLHADAAASFVRVVSEESDLRSAIFLEQAAMSYYASTATRRKAAFHLVLAAFRFVKAHQRHHARRCYTQAEQLFSGLNWRHVDDHIHQSLARQCEQLGLLDKSIAAYAHVLRECPGTPRSHEDVLATFIQLYRHLQESAPEAVPPLPVPLVNGDIHVRLQMQGGQRKEPTTVAAQEEAIAAFMRKPPVKQLDTLSDQTSNTAPATVVVHEPVGVEFRFTNPLAIPLRLTSLKLVCELVGSGGKPCPEDQLEMTEMVEIELGARQALDVVLTAKPLAVGRLRVKGIRYKMHLGVSSAAGQQPLHTQGRRLNSTIKQRRERVYEEDMRLELDVVHPCPLITYQSTSLPSEVLQGEVVALDVDLKNQGQAATTDVVCAFPMCALQPLVELEDGTALHADDKNCVDLSSRVALDAGATARFRARFRVAQHPPNEFVLCVGYRGVEAPQELPYRLVKITGRTRTAEGPLVTASLLQTSAACALLQLVFSPVTPGVVLERCLLRDPRWRLDAAAPYSPLPDNPQATRVALLPCVRTGPLRNGEGGSQEPSLILQSQPAEAAAQERSSFSSTSWPLPAFSSKNGVHVMWSRGDQVGLTTASIADESAPATAYFEVLRRKESNFDANDAASASAQSFNRHGRLHARVCGTGFAPGEEVTLRVPSRATGIKWLGKAEYSAQADEEGQMALQLSALVLTAGTALLEGAVIHRRQPAPPIDVQPLVVSQY